MPFPTYCRRLIFRCWLGQTTTRVAGTKSKEIRSPSGWCCLFVLGSVQYNDDIFFWQAEGYDNRVLFATGSDL